MKTCLKAISAFICSFFLVNFLCMFYYSGPGDLYRDHGATGSIRMPDSRYVNAAEGFAVVHFDRNGYNNMDGKLEKPYVLIMGSSHMEATYVWQEQNTASILNDLLGGTDTDLRTYNIAHANTPLPDIIKGFQAGIGEFPDSCAVVIEIYDTSFSVSDLQDALQQTSYNVDSSGAYLSRHLTDGQKLRSSLIGCMPFAKYVLNRQLGNFSGSKDPVSGSQTGFEANDYKTALNAAFSLIRNEYTDPIIVLYHPEVDFCKNNMTIVRDEDSYDIFKGVCEDNGMIFVDTGDAFMRAFEDHLVVPYGFQNTAIGDGHLNADGHRIVARELYQVLKDLPGVTWE